MTIPARGLRFACLLTTTICTCAHADPSSPPAGVTLYANSAVDLRLGGTVHIDGRWLEADEDASFGSPMVAQDSDVRFARAYLSLLARFHDWTLLAEPDFAARDARSRTNIAARELYLAAPLPAGRIQIGQRRPFRGMEELTGDNDLLMIARPFASAAGAFAVGQSREFLPGIYYQGDLDAFAWGLGAYSLRSIGRRGVDGVGASGRLTWAPLSAAGEVVHLGVSFTWEDPHEDGSIGGAAAYAGEPAPPAVTGVTGNGETAMTTGLEYANAFGPFFAQAEFMLEMLSQAGGAPNEDVFAYYVQGSYAITGETRPYDRAQGTFRAPRPHQAGGAWELTARYDAATNRDVAAVGGGCGGGPAVDRCDVWAVTLGVNYTLNPHVRFMLNYGVGEQDRGSFGHDRPRTLAARIQLSY